MADSEKKAPASLEKAASILGGLVLLTIFGVGLGYKFREAIGAQIISVKTIISEFQHHPLTTDWRYGETGGFGLQMYDARGAEGHLLASGFFADSQSTEIRLIDLSSGETVKTWRPDAYEINDRAIETWQVPKRFEPQSPMPTEDGGLIFIYNQGPLVRVNACSEIVWLADGQQHHSIEIGLDGNLLVPSVDSPLDPPYDELRNDTIARFDPKTGEMLDSISVAKLLLESGNDELVTLLRVLYPRYFDAIHLNDVEEAKSDGPFWQKGDWALSMRMISLVMIYRPSTGKIVWYGLGPWDKQHDPDFNSNGTFSVFSNHVVDFWPHVMDKGHSEVIVLGADQVPQYPYSKVLAENSIGTLTQGKVDILANGDAFIEETDHGRLVRIGPDKLVWAFNNFDGKRAGVLNWSRYYPPGELPEGALILCPEG